jgi:hypothetical protein
MPRAKRRLAEEGPPNREPRTATDAAFTLAAELRLRRLPEDAARKLAEAMPGVPPQTRRRLAAQVHAAYHPHDGRTILTGCPRDNRPRSGSLGTSRLRETFASYCDEECARTCPILRAIRSPGRTLQGTAYEALDRSDVWAHGGGLSAAGHTVYRLLATMAVTTGDELVLASANYLCLKSDGTYTPQHIGKMLTKLDRLGIATLVDKRTGLRRVRALDEEAVLALERELGVSGKRQANIAEARRRADAYLAYRAELDDPEEAWNPAPRDTEASENETEKDTGRLPPRFLRPWGGTIPERAGR